MNHSRRTRFSLPILAWVAGPIFFLGCKSSDLASDGIPPAKLPKLPKLPEMGGQGAEYTVPASATPIRTGDTLELFVEEDDSFNGTYSVRERGDIIIPTVGRIPVRGMSVIDAGARIRSKLEATHLKTANVMLDRVGRAQSERAQSEVGGRRVQSEASTTIRIFMTGKVQRPGQHRVPIPEGGAVGVYEAILIAGGISDFGDLQKVHLLRSDDTGKRRKVPVNIRMIEKGLAKDPPIGDGDIVVVPEKVFGF